MVARWALLVFCLAVQDDPARQARELVDKLRSDKVDERDDAARKLRDLGKAALPELEKAARSADAEVAGKAKDLIRVISVTMGLTPELRKAMPGVENRLATGDADVWKEIFLEVVSRDERGTPKHPRMRRADLDVLAGPALEAAVDLEEKKTIGAVSADRCLRSAIPGIVALLRTPSAALHWEAASWLVEMRARESIPDVLALVEGKNEHQRTVAVSLLARLGSKELIPELLKRFRTGDDRMRIQAARGLIALGVKEALPGVVDLIRKTGAAGGWSATLGFRGMDGRDILPDLLALLKNEHEGVRQGAVELVGALGLKDAGTMLVKLLKDPAEGVRAESARSLARLGEKDCVSRIVPLLGDPSSYVQIAAVHALAVLGASDAVPAIQKMLGGAGSWVAAEALGRLKAKESIPSIHRVLSHEQGHARRAAVEALAALGAKESAPAIARLLSDPDSGCRYAAFFAIESLGAKDQDDAIARHLSDKEEFVRHGAARVLCLLGNPKGLPILLQDEAYLTWLNALRAPEAWRRLHALRVATPIEGTAREILDLLAKQADLKLECPADPYLDRFWMRINWETINLLDAAADAAGAAYAVLLESDRIRIVPRDDAIEFWREWEKRR